ncbi:MAG: hypothetical protein V4472_25690 [Pseudomonadota bacterium]
MNTHTTAFIGDNTRPTCEIQREAGDLKPLAVVTVAGGYNNDVTLQGTPEAVDTWVRTLFEAWTAEGHRYNMARIADLAGVSDPLEVDEQALADPWPDEPLEAPASASS